MVTPVCASRYTPLLSWLASDGRHEPSVATIGAPEE